MTILLQVKTNNKITKNLFVFAFRMFRTKSLRSIGCLSCWTAARGTWTRRTSRVSDFAISPPPDKTRKTRTDSSSTPNPTSGCSTSTRTQSARDTTTWKKPSRFTTEKKTTKKWNFVRFLNFHSRMRSRRRRERSWAWRRRKKRKPSVHYFHPT